MVGAGVFGWGLVICAISTFCGVWCGAVFQCRNFKEKSMARPSKRKPLARVKRDTKQSWEVAFLGGRKNQPPNERL